MPLPKVPDIPYEAMRTAARDFLRKHHAEGKIPVPIEEMVEFGLGLDIVPVPGLERDFNLDGFLSSDLGSIEVDQWQLQRQEVRYRFTLAHEVGHLLLHAGLYRGSGIRDVASFLRFQSSIDDITLYFVERQANDFAGLVLVPLEPLLKEFQELHAKYWSLVAKRFKKPDHELYWGLLCDKVAERFNVSAKVVEIRAVRDRVRGRILQARA